MARMIIELRTDKRTGHPELVVHLESEPDQLPHEQEAAHRELVEQLVQSPLNRLLNISTIRVERVAPHEFQDRASLESSTVDQREHLDHDDSGRLSSSD